MKTFSFIKPFFILILLVSISCKNEKNETYKVVPKNEKKEVFLSTKVIPDDHYLGDKKCKECHEKAYNEWENSHHDLAMQVATRATVLANFKGEKFYSQGVTSLFFEKNGVFYANTEGPDGKNHDYKIEYVFGVTPLQQYIVKFPDGHYQCLRQAWDTQKNKWFDLYPDFKVVHSEWLHWSRGGLNWNNMCADCHSTNVRKNYTLENHSYDTKYSIINVSCEACHGPGKQHVTDVEKMGVNYKNSGSLQMTSEVSPKELVDQCARCHMRREQFTKNFNHEGTLLDHYYPQLLDNTLYHPDGQILDEVYVYGSFVQSKMYHNNVTCTDCHNPHTLEKKFKGNQLCAQCHVPETYDTEAHHFHKKNTEGAKCINCHMTGKYYMGNDFRRDHSFRIPRPDQSIKYGTPNACTSCHKDKNNEWALDNYTQLFGTPKNNHFSDLLAPGLARTHESLASLNELAKDTAYPNIARASAVLEMGNYPDKNTVNQLLAYLNDSSDLVKGASLDALSQLSNPQNFQYFFPLLKADKRTIRVKAFAALAGVDKNKIPSNYIYYYKKVEKEFTTYLEATADFVGGRVKKANYELRNGNLNGAISGYESALKIDPLNNAVRTNLANIYYRNKSYTKAEKAFKTIIEQEPTYGQTYYSYGLLLAELKRTKEATQQLELALKYMPKNIRVYYNLSLMYDQVHETKKAENIIIKGLKIDNKNESLLYLLAYHYFQHQQKEKAKNIAEQLVQLYPNKGQYYQFLQQVQ